MPDKHTTIPRNQVERKEFFIDAKMKKFPFWNKRKFLLLSRSWIGSQSLLRNNGFVYEHRRIVDESNRHASLAPHRDNVTCLFQQPRRLLGVGDVATWLGVSKGWVRDHASGRRQPKLQAIKLGSRKGKGLWKFREEDVQQFLCDRNCR